MSNVQRVKPRRKCKKNYINYRSFKPYLREDFNERCGYCDDLDSYFGGRRGFHIEHFKPHSIPKFSHLKSIYKNLVYSCPYCNDAKSDTWKANGFIDPCSNVYDKHLYRVNNGSIMYSTNRGEYIYLNLNLGHRRHQLLWQMDKFKDHYGSISTLIDNLPTGVTRNNLLEISRLLQEWINYLEKDFRTTI